MTNTYKQAIPLLCPHLGCGKRSTLVVDEMKSILCSECHQPIDLQVRTLEQRESAELSNLSALYAEYCEDYYCASWLKITANSIVSFKEFLRSDISGHKWTNSPEWHMSQEDRWGDIQVLQHRLKEFSEILSEREATIGHYAKSPVPYTVSKQVRNALKSLTSVQAIRSRKESGQLSNLLTEFTHKVEIGAILPESHDSKSSQFTVDLTDSRNLKKHKLLFQITDISEQDEYEKAEAAYHPLNMVTQQVARTLESMQKPNLIGPDYLPNAASSSDWVSTQPDTNTFEISCNVNGKSYNYLVKLTGRSIENPLVSGTITANKSRREE